MYNTEPPLFLVQRKEKMEQLQETKEQKFIRLAEYRMNKAIKAVESISNLANKSSYEYSEEQVGAMFSVLENTIADVKSAFLPKKERGAFSFSGMEGGMSCEGQQ